MNWQSLQRQALALGLVLLGATATGARATIVNFDDLTGYAPVPAGYAGLTWNTGLYCADQTAWPGIAHSPNRFIFNRVSSDNVKNIDFPAPVYFNGAWVAAYYMPYNAPLMRFVCFGGPARDVPLGSSGWQALGAQPVFLPVDIDGVTRVVAEYSTTGHFLIDDLTYNEGVVPNEAATWGEVKGLFR